MTFWTPRNLRAVVGGQWLRQPTGGDGALLTGISTDTRAVKPGEVFVALRGERFDAHDFLDSAASAGAAMLIVSETAKLPASLGAGAPPGGPAVLKVPDTLRALGQIAGAYRATLTGTKVIAVVGSNGKTTTSRLIHSVLSSKLRGSASPKSFNNEVGVPVTIFGAKPGDQYLVCEVGSNHPGETARLTRIVKPDIAVITSVGRDHLEFFGDTRAVAREHAAVLADVREGGTVVAPHECEELAEHLRGVANLVTFGAGEGATLRVTGVAHESAGEAVRLRVTINHRCVFVLGMAGTHNAMNAAAAVAVGRRLGLDDAAIASGLASATPADMRLNQKVLGGVRLLIDCYNANPDSVIAAARTLMDVASGVDAGGGRGAGRVFVLGDMLEMGAHSDAAHREVGIEIARVAAPTLLVTVGEAAKLAGEEAARRGVRVEHVPSLEGDGARRVAAMLTPGDTAVLKASRGVRLERVVEALAGERGVAPGVNVVAGGQRVAL